MDAHKVRMAVVGVGYFGTYHCEKIAVLPDAELVGVVDLDEQRAQRAADRFSVRRFEDHRALAGEVDAAIVAVPAEGHFAVASDLLSAGIDLLVEKPLAVSLEQAEELCQLVRQRSACLQVGHLERFNPIMAEALARLDSPRFIRMERLGPYPGRGSSADVVFELMIHDLDIVRQITQAPVRSVSAFGWSVVTDQLDVVSAQLEFADELRVELTASRAASNTRRAFSVLDSQGLLEVDLAQRRLRQNKFVKGHQETDELALDGGDPLLEQDRSFVHVLTNGRVPLAGEQAGREAVALAEDILSSLRRAEHGQQVYPDPPLDRRKV